MLIANQNYSHFQKLQTAEEDVRMLAAELRRLGFSVLTLANLTLREMQEAENIFCNRLLSQFVYCIRVTTHTYILRVQHNEFTHLDDPL